MIGSFANTTRRGTICSLIGTVCLFITIGCDSDPATIEALRSAVRQSQSPDGAVNDVSRQRVRSDANYEAPYPGRLDPFIYPESSETRGSSARQDLGVSAGQITVLGFAEVGTPRVILRVSDETKVVVVGDKFAGVEVVRIDPPRVELRMDNLTWTATMFDDRGQ